MATIMLRGRHFALLTYGNGDLRLERVGSHDLTFSGGYADVVRTDLDVALRANPKASIDDALGDLWDTHALAMAG